MHEAIGFSIWESSANVFVVALGSNLLGRKTETVDVLWLALTGSVHINLGLLPSHNEFLETVGEWSIASNSVSNFVRIDAL